MIPVIVKIVLTASFLIYFAAVDFKKREVGNLPVFLMVAPAVIFLTDDLMVASLGLGLLSCAAIVFAQCFLLWIYHRGVIGGADFKILVVISLIHPLHFFPLFVGSGLMSLIYLAAARMPALNRFLQIERGIPFCVCLLPAYLVFAAGVI